MAEGEKILSRLKYYSKMKSLDVKAGWDKRTKNKEGEYPAEYMKHNEFGTKHIPPRPALGNTSKKNQSKWKRMAVKSFQAQMDAKTVGVLIGSRMRSDIQETIVNNVPPPNAPATVAAKAKKYNTTGTLRASLFALENVTFQSEVK